MKLNTFAVSLVLVLTASVAQAVAIEPYYKVNANFKCYDGVEGNGVKPKVYRNKDLVKMVTDDPDAQLVTESSTLRLHVVDKCGEIVPGGANVLNNIGDNCAASLGNTEKWICVKQLEVFGSGDVSPLGSAFCKENWNSKGKFNRSCAVQILNLNLEDRLCTGKVNSGGKPFKPDNSCAF